MLHILVGMRRWVQGDAMSMPFGPGEFHAVTMGYGLRNVASIPDALSELHRVLKPGRSMEHVLDVCSLCSCLQSLTTAALNILDLGILLLPVCMAAHPRPLHISSHPILDGANVHYNKEGQHPQGQGDPHCCMHDTG